LESWKSWKVGKVKGKTIPTYQHSNSSNKFVPSFFNSATTIMGYAQKLKQFIKTDLRDD